MQGIQISPLILEAIFLDQTKLQKSMIKELIAWNQQLEPSVNMTQFIISSFLIPQNNSINDDQPLSQRQNINKESDNLSEQSKDRILKATKDVPKTIKLLQEYKCPKNFLRAYLLFIKKNYYFIRQHLNLEYVLQQWKFLSPQLFQSYCDTFQILIQNYSQVQENQTQQKLLYIKADEFDKKIQELIQKKQYSNCMTLIKLSNCQKHHINKLLTKMTNNKEASKAADYVKSLKLNPADYPALGERLYKNTARHFLTKNGWEYAEEIFQTHPQALACIIEDLIFKKKTRQAISIWYRNQKCRQFIIKQETLEFFKPYIESKGQMIKPQELVQNFLQKDEFGPSNKQTHLQLEQMGVKQQHVIWVNENSQQLDVYLKQISNSEILGIDTQSIVGQTKFDKSQHSKFSQAALIQIATRDKIFIFDGLTAKDQLKIKNTILSYIKQNRLIVGHTLDNDMDCLLKSLGCSDDQIKQLKNMKVVDVWKLFKAVYPKKKFSSLAFICQNMLGKQLCKVQTLTNWQRRPLRRNQMHYAAMDAFVVIKIYDKFIEEIGQQMIEYYCSMDLNQF